MQETNILTLSPGLLQQFNRIKIKGHYSDNQVLLKACFEALEQELDHRGQPGSGHPGQPYMSHPGLSPDDYDT